jgi:carbonic anhydrase/acetyltransferase-like protein (isoleucine patch superfamily)
MREKPQIHPTAYIAPNAIVLGNVTIAEEASVWFGCVLRAEVAEIVIGPRSNVQDLTAIHTDPKQPCRLGRGVTVGHRVVLYGATIEDGALIGIGAIVLDGAVIGEEAVIGAGAVVTPGAVIPPRTLALGTPAKVVQTLDEGDLLRLRKAAGLYVEHGRMYREEGGKE